MEFFSKHFKSSHKFFVRRIIILFITVVVGLITMLFFSGKSFTDIDAITVSSDEEYIAFFETGDEYKIHCFKNDGTLMFNYSITPELSAGGYCTMWFHSGILCVLFYRTNKIVYFSTEGRILSDVENITQEKPPTFSNFNKEGNRFIYKGDRINVIYDKQNFFEYWILNKERYISIVRESNEIILKSWQSKG